MKAPIKANLQLVYVKDIEASTAFYNQLFTEGPTFTSPRYVAYHVGGGALFALWSGGSQPETDVPRYSEIGIMLPRNEDVDACFEDWQARLSLNIVQPPTTDVFGRTFVITDLDGHTIRVCPID